MRILEFLFCWLSVKIRDCKIIYFNDGHITIVIHCVTFSKRLALVASNFQLVIPEMVE